MRDDLGERMKVNYENRARYYLPRRTYTIVRIDGKNFHAYARGLERPFDAALMEDMDRTALALCREIEGCAFGFVQSDEISLLLTDFAGNDTQAWFDGCVQKIASLTASIATAEFNRARWERQIKTASETSGEVRIGADFALARPACFDSRAFCIPDPTEVENYFLWRQQDATRNSISMAAQALYSQEELHGKKSEALQEALWRKGVNWNDYPAGCKRGRAITRAVQKTCVTYTHGLTGVTETAEVERACWQVEAPPIFTADRAYLAARIPRRDDSS